MAPARREAEATAGLLLAVIGAHLVIVALVTAGPLRGTAFPGVSLVAVLPALAALCAWGLRHVPRPVGGLLAVVTLGGTAWLLWLDRSVETRGWLAVDSDAPWGPLVVVFPDFTRMYWWPVVVCVLIAVGVVVLVWRERRAAGEWRRAAAASRTSKALH